MDSVTILWSASNYHQLREQHDCYLYAVTFEDELLYIGMAYRQTVQARTLRKDHIRDKYQAILDGITVWLGEIIYKSFSRISEDRIQDIECLLIYVNQPKDNRQCKISYTGRPNLRVRSKWFPHLIEEVSAKNGVCYPQHLYKP